MANWQPSRIQYIVHRRFVYSCTVFFYYLFWRSGGDILPVLKVTPSYRILDYIYMDDTLYHLESFSSFLKSTV
jgi:hypothetical protein